MAHFHKEHVGFIKCVCVNLKYEDEITKRLTAARKRKEEIE